VIPEGLLESSLVMNILRRAGFPSADFIRNIPDGGNVSSALIRKMRFSLSALVSLRSLRLSLGVLN